MTRAFMAPVVVLATCLVSANAFAQDKEIQKLEKKVLKDKDASVRAQAAWDLGQRGATDSVPVLAQALKDSSSAVRANAAASLWKLGSASKPAIPELKLALEDHEPSVVGNAAGALSKLGVPKSQLVPAYKRVLQMPGCEAKVIGLKGLADELPPTGLFDDAWACSQAQTKTHEEAEARSQALSVLRDIVRRRDTLLVPQILAALKALRMSEDPSDLTSALGNIEPPVKDAVPVLVAMLTSRNERAPKSAVSALGRMGAAGLTAVPQIVDLLQGKGDVDTRAEAAEALGKLGPKAATGAVPALTKVAEGDQWPKVRKAALEALGEMGPAAKSAIPVLRAALKDPDAWTSQAARNALFRVDPNSREEVSAISDKSRPVQKGRLFDDVSQLATALPAKVPEVYELMIYDDFAMVESPYPSSKTGRGKFTYRGGAVSGPEEESADDCKKTMLLSKVDFAVVPKIVQQAPTLLGAPTGKVIYASLSGGIFCKAIGWTVYVEKAGRVEFKLDGKVGKIQKD
jgi:HEAT repeat protein